MEANEKLTKDFEYKEFFSGDVKVWLKSIEPPAKYLNKIILMAEELQIVRDYIGSPIIITSAYRTPAWNNYCGGVPSSYHTKCEAVDIKVNGMPPYDLAVYVANLQTLRDLGLM